MLDLPSYHWARERERERGGGGGEGREEKESRTGHGSPKYIFCPIQNEAPGSSHLGVAMSFQKQPFQHGAQLTAGNVTKNTRLSMSRIFLIP